METKNAIRGSLIGGAVGDALGYAVEFMDERRIFKHYGDDGIRAYQTDKGTGKALISDDTQMTLFTANAILWTWTRQTLRGVSSLQTGMEVSYSEWYLTQSMSFGKYHRQYKENTTWLMDVPELFAPRAPGNTCLYALEQMRRGQEVCNNSKGCGGVMRVAPMGLADIGLSEEGTASMAAMAAEITHQHPLGYMTGAMLGDLIRRIVYGREGHTLKELVLAARQAMSALYSGQAGLDKMLELVDRAVLLAEGDGEDLDNIHQLGEGWVAEETLAIAIYCALRHQGDFSAAMIASVNHKGDSDSTGAVAGNILGAWLGFDAIGPEWKRELELYDVILEMADDLDRVGRMRRDGTEPDADWIRKYVHGQWRETAQA